MRFGQWTVKYDGCGYVVGKAKVRERDGKPVEHILKPKYYGSVVEALRNLPEREAADCWNDCEDMETFRERMEIAMKEIIWVVEIVDVMKDKL